MYLTFLSTMMAGLLVSHKTLSPFVIFNKDPGDDNMQEWKDNMESELERTLAHPFIHGPDLAESLEVVGIPTMFFVNSEGDIVHTMVGIKNKTTVENFWNDLS